MQFNSIAEMKSALEGSVRLAHGRIDVANEQVFRADDLDRLVYSAVFGDDQVKAASRWVIWEAALQMGAMPASIQGMYQAAGKEGILARRTVPAMNLRGITYDMARAAFRAALAENVGTLIFEIARSEMGYTSQRPSEYATVVLAAALKEGFRGPVFIQGDHFQLVRSNYERDANAEVGTVRSLIEEALDGGFYNIDIDASTLVDITKKTVAEQQTLNVKYTAEMTSFIRQHQPAGVTVSVGGEIGEVGGHNSTVEELKTFMDEYLRELGSARPGISKISIQTGTVHGGVPLAGGGVADVKLDFDRLKELSEIARKDYGLAGAVQHGASTLPDDYFDLFPKMGAAEVHLATGFQNIVFNSPAMPRELRDRMYAYLADKRASERKQGETDEQFYYKTRKRAWGPFKQELWNMPSETREQLSKELQDQFTKLYRKLGVTNSKDLPGKYVKPEPVHKPAPASI
ncbi:MAG: class II fructose-bisphosphate aldolase [Dehalococcoidales bacterium]|nr:class II fructose-bisphosphate aldolase [Dehalococcoidales bacterium]